MFASCCSNAAIFSSVGLGSERFADPADLCQERLSLVDSLLGRPQFGKLEERQGAFEGHLARLGQRQGRAELLLGVRGAALLQ